MNIDNTKLKVMKSFLNLVFSATMKFLSAKDMMTPSTKVYKMLFLTSAKPAKKNFSCPPTSENTPGMQ